MANYNNYTLFYGYCIDEKFDYIKNFEDSEEKYWDGIPEFSLNYNKNKVGYKIVKDNIGTEELYFGVKLCSLDEYSGISSKCYNLEELKQKYIQEINNKYYHLFNEVPDKELQICLISECL